jgi:hypothetical protein
MEKSQFFQVVEGTPEGLSFDRQKQVWPHGS